MSGGTVPDTATRLRRLLGVGRREFLTTDEVARDYKFPSAEAARKFIRRHAASHGLPYEKRGRAILVDRREFDALMTRLRLRRSA